LEVQSIFHLSLFYSHLMYLSLSYLLSDCFSVYSSSTFHSLSFLSSYITVPVCLTLLYLSLPFSY
jgi:hypothetical protein